jgi:hypothetical protein
MSALGQKQTLSDFSAMSALPPKADIGRRQLDVRFVPQADMLGLLLIKPVWARYRRHLRQSRPPDIAAPAGLEYARAVVTARAKCPCRIAARAASALCWEQMALVRLMWQELLRVLDDSR